MPCTCSYLKCLLFEWTLWKNILWWIERKFRLYSICGRGRFLLFASWVFIYIFLYVYIFICNCSRSIWKSRHMRGLNYIYLCRISQCCLFRKWLQLWIQNIRVRTTTNFLCFVCRSACYVIVYSSYINTFL